MALLYPGLRWNDFSQRSTLQAQAPRSPIVLAMGVSSCVFGKATASPAAARAGRLRPRPGGSAAPASSLGSSLRPRNPPLRKGARRAVRSSSRSRYPRRLRLAKRSWPDLPDWLSDLGLRAARMLDLTPLPPFPAKRRRLAALTRQAGSVRLKWAGNETAHPGRSKSPGSSALWPGSRNPDGLRVTPLQLIMQDFPPVGWRPASLGPSGRDGNRPPPAGSLRTSHPDSRPLVGGNRGKRPYSIRPGLDFAFASWILSALPRPLGHPFLQM